MQLTAAEVVHLRQQQHHMQGHSGAGCSSKAPARKRLRAFDAAVVTHRLRNDAIIPPVSRFPEWQYCTYGQQNLKAIL